MVYVIAIILIINAYVLGGIMSLKSRSDNYIFTTDYVKKKEAHDSTNETPDIVKNKSIIYGSSKGKYFYYKGCGVQNISAKNLVYYKSEDEAKSLGKLLHKSCE
jgi:hypothetical protein